MAKHSAMNGPDPVADEVLNYLVNHEGADDTVEGIVSWWLPMQQIEHAIQTVEAALRNLVARGFVSAHQASDGRVHYRMNAKRERAIRCYLKGTAESATRPGRRTQARKQR